MGAAFSNVSLLQDKEFKRVLTKIGSWRITEGGWLERRLMKIGSSFGFCMYVCMYVCRNERTVMAEGTRSRSKSEKSNTSATEVQSIPLNLVKEMLSVQESALKSFFTAYKNRWMATVVL